MTYVSGTTTVQLTYTDSTGTVANSDPVVLDSGGYANIWLNPLQTYRFIVTTAPLFGTCSLTNLGTLISQTDGISGSGGGGSAFLPTSGGTMTGSILVNPTDTVNLGSSPTSEFLNIWSQNGIFSGHLTMGSTQVFDNAGNATVHNLTVAGACTGCGNFLPLAGGTMTGNILVTPTDTVNLGSNTSELNNIYVKNLNVSGSCTGAGCGGGGAFLPLSGGVMSGAITFSTVGTIDVGGPTLPGGTYWAFNMKTKKLIVENSADSDLSGSNFFNSTASVSSTNQSWAFNDTSNAPMLQLVRVFASNPINLARFDSHVDPLSDNTYDLGGPFPVTGQAAWRNIYMKGNLVSNGNVVLDPSRNATVNNLTILGTCSGCPGTGGGTYLPLAGGTMTGAINFSTVGTLDVGSASHPTGTLWGMNAKTQKFILENSGDADLTGTDFVNMTAVVTSTNQSWAFNDTANNPMLQLVRVLPGTPSNPVNLARFDLSLEPLSDNAYDLGGTFPVAGQAAWRNIYYKGALIQNNATVIDTNRNATVNNLIVQGTCTGCPGGGAFLPLAGGTMTGSILVSPTDTINLGSNSSELNNIYVRNINITGTCTGAGCAGAGVTSIAASFPLQASAASGAVTLSCPLCGVLTSSQNWSGNNTFTGSTTVSGLTSTAAILPSVANAVNLGNGLFPWNLVQANQFSGQTLNLGSSAVIGGNVITSGFVQAASVISSTTGFSVNGTNGVTATIAGLGCGSLHFSGGVFTGCF